MIVAHENSGPSGLPVVNYTDSVRFHLNGENIHAIHIGPAHTNGDSFGESLSIVHKFSYD